MHSNYRAENDIFIFKWGFPLTVSNLTEKPLLRFFHILLFSAIKIWTFRSIGNDCKLKIHAFGLKNQNVKAVKICDLPLI